MEKRVIPNASPPQVGQAAPQQLVALSRVLARAFAADPMLRWPLGDVAEPERAVEACFQLWNHSNIALGVVLEVHQGAGVAVWVPPELAVRCAELERRARPAISALSADNGARYERMWDWVNAQGPHEAKWYLDYIGVDPLQQGAGLGSALMHYGLARADEAGLPAFLETATPRNVAYYTSFGFRVLDTAWAPGGGPQIWFMRRDPSE
jgi:ribosomal protein S18 acetylase RimI-like enzyme